MKVLFRQRTLLPPDARLRARAGLDEGESGLRPKVRPFRGLPGLATFWLVKAAAPLSAGVPAPGCRPIDPQLILDPGGIDAAGCGVEIEPPAALTQRVSRLSPQKRKALPSPSQETI